MGSRDRARPICYLCRAPLRVVFVWARASIQGSSGARPPPLPVPPPTAAPASGPLGPRPSSQSVGCPSANPQVMGIGVAPTCEGRGGGGTCFQGDSGTQLAGMVWKHVGPGGIFSLARSLGSSDPALELSLPTRRGGKLGFAREVDTCSLKVVFRNSPGDTESRGEVLCRVAADELVGRDWDSSSGLFWT